MENKQQKKKREKPDVPSYEEIIKLLKTHESSAVCCKILKTLSAREEKVLRLKFGIGVKSKYTDEEIAQDFRITKDEVKKIENKALRKLRHPLRIKLLRNLIETNQL